MLKFKEMPYERPDPEELKAGTAAMIEKLRNAATYE